MIAVGATTRNGCQADYSNSGVDLDVVGARRRRRRPDADNASGRGHLPARATGSWIYQQTFTVRACARFGLPGGYEGTSMASPARRRPSRR